MTLTKSILIGLGVPMALAAIGVGVAVEWQRRGPAGPFELRGESPSVTDTTKAKPTLSPELAASLRRLAVSLVQMTAPMGQLSIPLGDVVIPPGVLTKGDGERAENVPGVWPQFLGPKRNALSVDFTPLADSWPPGGPPVVWSVDLGRGHAGPAIYDGCVYLLDYHADAEKANQGDVLRRLSMKDGREIWRYWYPVSLVDDHGISRTVPAIAEDYVVTIGPSCHVMCVDALTGQYQWWMNLVERYKTRVPEWYASQCPLIDDGKAIIATGGKKLMIAVALAPETEGRPTILWEVDNPVGAGEDADGLHITHASVVPMTFKGKRIYLYCTTKGIVAVGTEQTEDGQLSAKLLWRYERWQPGINTVSPVVLDDERFAVAAADGGLILRLVEGGGGAVGVEKVADLNKKVLSSYHQTPVLDGGYLYVVLSQKAGRLAGQLACLDVRGDEVRTLWLSGREDRFRWGPYLKAEDRMLLLNDNTGELTMARVSPAGYKRLARAKLLHNHDAWAPMALVSGRLLLRDVSRMICVDLRANRPSPPAGKASATE